MTTKNSKFHMVAAIVAALGLSSCTVDPEEASGAPGAGITVDLRASEETLADVGVSSWKLVPATDQTLVVTGLDELGGQAVQFTITSNDEELKIEMFGDVEGVIVIAADGTMIENTLDDVAVLQTFRDDSNRELEESGFRGWGECAVGVGGTGLACANAWKKKTWGAIVNCGGAAAGAASSCWDAATGNGGGQTMTGGNSDGGNSGGNDSDGGGDDGGGAEDGGDGEDGGGYGEDGGGEDGGGYGEDGGGEEGGGYGEDGGGEDGGGYGEGGYGEGGYGEGGYGEGGYGEGGYGEGGYGEGGYGEGGYGEGGYGYAPVDTQGRFSAAGGGIPTGGTMRTTFNRGVASRQRVKKNVWNLEAPKKRRTK